MTPSRLRQVSEILAGLEAEISEARDELRRLESERRKIGTTLTVSLGANHGLVLDLGGESKTHSVRIPCSEKGAQVMLRILQDRERSWDRSLGSEARPVQAQVQKWLAQANAAESDASRAAQESTKAKAKLNGASLPDLNLEDLGI